MTSTVLSLAKPEKAPDSHEVVENDEEAPRRTGRKRQVPVDDDFICDLDLPKDASAASTSADGPKQGDEKPDSSSDSSDSSSESADVKVKKHQKLTKPGIRLLKLVMNAMTDQGINPMTNRQLSRDQKDKYWRVATNRFNSMAAKSKATRSLLFEVQQFKMRVQHQARNAKDDVSLQNPFEFRLTEI